MTLAWTQVYQGAGNTSPYDTVAITPTLGIVPEVGFGGNAPAFALTTSDGGGTWAEQNAPISFDAVFWTGIHFIGVGSQFGSISIYYSTDSISWNYVDTLGTGWLFNNSTKTLLITHDRTNPNVDIWRMGAAETAFTQVVTNGLGPNNGPGNYQNYFSNGGPWMAPHADTFTGYGTLFESNDDGITWTQVLDLTANSITVESVQYTGTGFALLGSDGGTGNNVVYSSTTGDIGSWTKTSDVLGFEPPYVAQAIVFNNVIYSTNGDFNVSYSSNGSTWQTTEVPGNTIISDMFVEDNILYAVGSGIVSTVNGTSWTLELAGNNFTFFRVRGTGAHDNLAVGFDENLSAPVIYQGLPNTITYPSGGGGQGGEGTPRVIIPTNDPQLLLSWSDSGTSDWSTEIPKNVGGVGESNNYMRWYRMGFGRNRVFKTQYRNPTAGLSLFGATVDVTATNG